MTNSGNGSIPSAALSWPSRSTSGEIRTPNTKSRIFQTKIDTEKTKAPTAITPRAWTNKDSPAAKEAASVPQIPAPMWAETAPTSSSIFRLSRVFLAARQKTAPVAPMKMAAPWPWISGPAAIATSPAIAPFRESSRSRLRRIHLETNVAVTTAAAAARLVFTTTVLIPTTSPAEPRLSQEPALKPIKPSQMMKTPSTTVGTLFGGVGFIVPSLWNFPLRAPTTMAPASAAHPPAEWTTVDPAKSLNPSSASQPPPHAQHPATG